MLDIEVARRGRAGREDRRLLRAEHRSGLHRRALDGRARHHATSHRSSRSAGAAPRTPGPQQARTQMEQILTEAAALGVTVTVASGDNGSTDGVNDGKQHVDFPASAPHALGCGGTSLQVHGRPDHERDRLERRLPSGGAGGGGISIEFAVPSYQSGRSSCRPTSTRASPAAACPMSPATPIPNRLLDPRRRAASRRSAARARWRRCGPA